MTRLRLVLVALSLAFGAGCAPPSGPSTSNRTTGDAAIAPSSSVVSAAASAPTPVLPVKHGGDAKIEWAFWTSEGKLVAASKTELFGFAVETAPPSHQPVTIAGMVARNGTDRFVVDDGRGGFTLWDARQMKAVGPISHPTPDRSGAIAPDGSLVWLGGCRELTDSSFATSCAEIYDGATGAGLGHPTTPHPTESFRFTDDGRFVVARSPSGAGGITVLDAKTGKQIFTRPRWSALLEIHGWNPPDLSEVIGDRIVLGHGDVIEVVELATGKTLAKTVQRGKTAAAFGPKMKRVAILKGDLGQVVVWDSTKGVVLRTFTIKSPASCVHCAVELDETSEDIVWLVSAYFPDKLALHVDTGVIEPKEPPRFRSVNVPSATHRLEEHHDAPRKGSASPGGRTCTIERRDRSEPSAPVPAELCNRTFGPSHVAETAWPYPGFDPSGKKLASIFEHELHVFDVERRTMIATMGQRDAPRSKRR